MIHDYGVRTTVGGYRSECSCGWTGGAYFGNREAAMAAALDHADSHIGIDTGKEYRTRRFVRTTEGMAEMFEGEGYR